MSGILQVGFRSGQINHCRSVAGVDCVGIGGDYNGLTDLADGVEDVSKYPDLFAALLRDKVIIDYDELNHSCS